MQNKSKGFTLIELVVAATIAAILLRIGYGNYMQYVARSNRSVAKSALISLAAKQEVQALQNGSYAGTFTPLNGFSGGAATSFYINHAGTTLTGSDPSAIYQIQFASPVPTACGAGTSGYAFQALAQGVQASRDASCSTLTLCSTGMKQAQNASNALVDPSSCWDK